MARGLLRAAARPTAGALLGTVALVAGAHVAGQARAQPAPKRYQLVWLRDGVGESCPGPLVVKGQVRRWLGRDPFLDEAPEVIEVAIGKHEDKFRAIVRSRDGQGRSRGERFFDGPGPDCSAVAHAATLAVVLIIDPDAPPAPPALAASRPPAPPPSPPAPSPLASPAPPPTAVAPAPPASLAPTPMPAPTPSAAAPAAPTQARAADGQGALAVIAGGGGGQLPGAAGLLGLQGERRVARGLWLRAALQRTGTKTTGDGNFAFSLTSGWLGLCGRWAGGENAEARLCAALGAGAMTAIVRRLEPLDAGDTPWLGGSLGLGGRLRPGGPWFLGANAEALVPLWAGAFRVEGPRAREVFRPGVGGQIYLELGVLFF